MDTRTIQELASIPELAFIRRVEGQDFTPTSNRPAPVVDDRQPRKRGIRCPKCHWIPEQSSRWLCSCAHCWNTFDTSGVCPACRRRWDNTVCLQCTGWSRHDEWYVA